MFMPAGVPSAGYPASLCCRSPISPTKRTGTGTPCRISIRFQTTTSLVSGRRTDGRGRQQGPGLMPPFMCHEAGAVLDLRQTTRGEEDRALDAERQDIGNVVGEPRLAPLGHGHAVF